MKTLLIFGLAIFTSFTNAQATETLRSEDYMKSKVHQKGSSVLKNLSQENSFPFKEEDLSFETLKKTRRFYIGNQHYRVHINNNLAKHLEDEKMQLGLIRIIKLLQKKTPSEEVVGYNFSYSNEKINASPYLGMNAK